MPTAKTKYLYLLNEPRCRFNGGYHTGASDSAEWVLRNYQYGEPWADARTNMRKFDRYFAAGFDAGQDARRAGDDCSSSDNAWSKRIK